jgi:hypothetical protein
MAGRIAPGLSRRPLSYSQIVQRVAKKTVRVSISADGYRRASLFFFAEVSHYQAVTAVGLVNVVLRNDFATTVLNDCQAPLMD